MSHIHRFFVVALFPVLAAGCGDSGPRRYGVTGTISIAGQPVKYGTIRFDPESGSGQEAGTGIVDGKYAVLQKTGLPAGRYKVTLTAPDKVIEGGGAPGSDIGQPVPKELFPKEYQDITKTPLRFDVTADGPNVFDHDSPPRK